MFFGYMMVSISISSEAVLDVFKKIDYVLVLGSQVFHLEEHGAHVRWAEAGL